MQNQDYKQKYFALLGEVEKPARYAGGEWNIPDMNKHRKGDMVFCFPELYEIGMSNLGVAILYDIVNKTDGYVAERCYAPAPDFAQSNTIFPLFPSSSTFFASKLSGCFSQAV